MTQKTRKWILFGAGGFVVYFFVAAQPVPVEAVVSPKWFISLESNYPVAESEGDEALVDMPRLLPFQLGNRFGYVTPDGKCTVNRIKKGELSISVDNWAEYDPAPKEIEVRNALDQPILKILEDQGYPVFLDKRIFLVSPELNSLSGVDAEGAVQWTHDFAATLTTIDAAAGFIVAGLLDGTVELLDNQGQRVFFFEPGGSRISVIQGCAISQDGLRLAVISGIDLQRFLLLERYGGYGDSGNIEYKVVYHEFLEEGFRRPVYMEFVDNDNRVAFERQGGLGIYEIHSRTGLKVPLEGEIIRLDESGSEHWLFLITAQEAQKKRLVAVRFPGTLIIEAPFTSRTFFLGRQGSQIYVGGNMTLASFELEKQ
ncbi:MAG: WD40 repeat domain-containing protein [Spirochaetaceae bacterium]|nr:WD40 repeat domain-containing protein [Spirochaetaceae bacterium]